MTPQKSRFKDELEIISPVAIVLAAMGFAAIQVLFTVLPKGPPMPWRIFLSLGAGAALAIWILIIGYINQDAKRRGMGQLLWTLIAIFVPNCLGILLYFLLRKPILQPCERCGCVTNPDFHFCPKCGLALSPSCLYCGRAIRNDFTCCPYCGKQVGATGPTVNGVPVQSPPNPQA
jgi:RNA polymerase subunit RPABC4/transcription elongation factor Spt4